MINTLEELNLALSSKDHFRNLIENGESFFAATQKFPDYAEALVAKVINDPEEFKRLIQTNKEWREAAKAFPHYADALIQPVLTDPQEFKRLIPEYYLLADTIKVFPTHKDSLVKVIVDNPEIFAHVVKDVSILNYFLLTNDSKFSLIFIEKIWQDPKEFQRLIKNFDDIMKFNNIFKDKNSVIQRIIDDPKEFKRIFKSDEDLKKADSMFPNHHEIFGKSTLEEAQHFVNSQHQSSIDYTKGATIGALSTGEFSKTLPADISGYISTFFNRKTGGRLAQVKKEAYELASEKKETDKQVDLTNQDKNQKPDITP